jgi:hypothetical protein
MRNTFTMGALLATMILLSVAPPARAGQLKSANDCVVGMRVVTNDGRKGKITKVDRAWSYCYVLFDGTGKEISFLYSLLNTDGPNSEPNDKLVPGVYECFGNGQYTFMDMRITGPSTYSMSGSTGKFHVESSSKIIFETGPLMKYNSKLLPGPKIGLTTTNENFYPTTCELNRSKR